MKKKVSYRKERGGEGGRNGNIEEEETEANKRRECREGEINRGKRQKNWKGD
jgi:hypothetical protein